MASSLWRRQPGGRLATGDLVDFGGEGSAAIAQGFWEYEPPTGDVYVRVWTGASWELKPIKVWTGASWETKPVYRWTGAAWVEV